MSWAFVYSYLIINTSDSASHLVCYERGALEKKKNIPIYSANTAIHQNDNDKEDDVLEFGLDNVAKQMAFLVYFLLIFLQGLYP